MQVFFAEVVGDVEEDDRAKKKENAQVGPEIQAHLYRDSRLPELQKSPVDVLSPNSVHAAVQSSKLRSDHVHKMSRNLRKSFGPKINRIEFRKESEQQSFLEALQIPSAATDFVEVYLLQNSNK